MVIKDMTGKKIGRLTVVAYSHIGAGGKAYWECKCECGNTCVISGDKLRRGHTKSCGCLQRKMRKEGNHKTHGMSNTRIYRIWANMNERCSNPNSDMYYNYGGRGITVCEDWKKPENFISWANKTGYKDGLSIERIDVNGNYQPSNCKWITPKEQSLNQRRSHFLTAFGKTQTIKEWADETGIKYDTIERRVNQYKWSAEDAVSKPVRRKRG